jgi:outer membrane protein OmpA-like peptidoglycan-associated protein
MKRTGKIILLMMAAMVVISTSFAGKNNWWKKYKRANKLYEKHYLLDAIDAYESILAKVPADSVSSIKAKLAKCYELTGNTIKAEELYASAGATADDVKFSYARVQQANMKYESAGAGFDKTRNANAAAFKKIGEDVKSNNFTNKDYEIEKLGLNTTGSEYAAVPYKKGVVFTTDRSYSATGQTLAWNGVPFTDLYMAEEDMKGGLTKIEKLPARINSHLNEGSACFNAAGDVMYFSRNNAKCKYKNKLEIVQSKMNKDGVWSKPKKLSFVINGYNYTHPSLSPDGNTLYFASDMQNGQGGMDLYTSKRTGDTWEAPVNMGKDINTAGNELFPFMGSNNTFYFSSNGQPGMGGLDIFSAIKAGGAWKVSNMKMPLNSPKDDFAFVSDDWNGIGYFSTNREGDDDIYRFRFVGVREIVKPAGEQITINKLVVADAKTGVSLAGVKVEVYDVKANRGVFYYTNDKGEAEYQFTPGNDYKISIEKEKFETSELNGERFVSAQGATPLIVQLTPMVEKDQDIYINNLFYETDKTDINSEHLTILQDVVSKLKSTAHTKITINGFADEQGNDVYNYGLSLRRAKNIEQYLTGQGVDPKLIQTNFYGGIKVTAECRKDPKCLKEVNKQNRRVEIKVVTF